MRSNRVKKVLSLAVLLGMALYVLAGCGGDTPTPVVLVVTSTFTPEPAVQVVTATFTPTTEAPPTDTPTVEVVPSDTAEPTVTLAAAAPIEYMAYDHPSGAFSLEIPQDAEINEREDGLFFFHQGSLMMILFAAVDEPLDSAAMADTIPQIVDEALLGEGLISSYSNLEIETDEESAAAGGSFDMTSDLFGEGEGGVVLYQEETTLYMLIFLTPSFDDLKEVWDHAVDSLSVTPLEPPEPTVAPQPPTNTPAPPTPTQQPKPTATSPPPPQANQGCYLIQNHLGAELTLTFTAQDRQWNDSFKIPANGEKEYCLDPGRYTYTIDAPPPWGTTNGDLEVNAGDRFLWPIRGE